MKLIYIIILSVIMISAALRAENSLKRVIDKNRIIYDFYSEKCGKLLADAKQHCIDQLILEKKQLVNDDKLQTAVEVKNIIKAISDNNECDKKDLEGLPQKIKIIYNTYLHRRELVNELQSESSEKLKKKILKEISEVSGVPESKINLLKKLFKSADFDYSDVEDILTGTAGSQSSAGNSNASESDISEKMDDILNGAFPIANNLLASDLNNEKGQLLFLYIEKFQPENKKIRNLRRNAECRSYIPVVPPQISEKEFTDKLEKAVSSFLESKNKSDNAAVSSALLLYLRPDSRLKGKINTEFANPDIRKILHYNKDIFGGTEEAEDLKLQLSVADEKEIGKILAQAEMLKRKYPKNKDVSDLMNELKKKLNIRSDKSAGDSAPIVSDGHSGGQKYMTCPKCHGEKQILCPQCVGSGISVEQEICPKCHGKGKNWLGQKCSECNGTGFIKRKVKCLNCNGTGKIVCPECNGTGQVPAGNKK